MLKLNTLITALLGLLVSIVIGLLSYQGNAIITSTKETHDAVIQHTEKIDTLTKNLDALTSKSDSWVTRQELNTKLYGARYAETNRNE